MTDIDQGVDLFVAPGADNPAASARAVDLCDADDASDASVLASPAATGDHTCAPRARAAHAAPSAAGHSGSRDTGIGPGRVRRGLDVVVAVSALLLTLPVLLLVALAVRLDSPGPVLYRQRRIGQGGRLFVIYKFRTMRDGASGSTLTAPGDNRITRIGSLLRRTALDELPQLFNVLSGSMTLVGPRPQTPALAERYPPDLAAIFAYRPGLTGPGVLLLNDDDVLPERRGSSVDVEGYYLRTIVPSRVALDLEYLTEPTLGRTLALMLATGARVLGLARPVVRRGRPVLAPAMAVGEAVKPPLGDALLPPVTQSGPSTH